MGRKVFLIGLPGSGKSTIACLLADRLGWKLVSTDALVAAQLGLPRHSALISAGESRYRQVERELMHDLLTDNPPEDIIVDCGSGALDNPLTLRELQELPGREIIELVIDSATMADRAGLNRPRSLGLGMPRAWLRQMGQARRENWKLLQALPLEVSNLSVEQVLERRMAALGIKD